MKERRKTKIELKEEVKKYKKRSKAFLLIIILLVLTASYGLYKYYNKQSSLMTGELKCNEELEAILQNQTNQTLAQFKENVCDDSELYKAIKEFFYAILKLDNNYFIKLLIFLGIIYLIQVGFSLLADIVEVIMLFFVLLKRIYKWIKSKFVKDKELT
jgi:hypothetical protein